MANENLKKAKNAKNDEFYTQYSDIQKEVNAYIDYNPDVFRDKTILLPCDDPEWSNFTKFFITNFKNYGIKKLISTSYAKNSKRKIYGQLDLFEEADFIKNSEKYDPNSNDFKGKIFTLTKEDDQVDLENLHWDYLEGDGDFRSDEVKKLRDEADFIITNPPFSMFREFIAWLNESNSRFLVIGNINAITYKEVFPLIKENKMWLGATGFMTDMVFQVPKGTEIRPNDKAKAEKLGYKGNYTRLGNSCWYSSIDHGRRHQPLQLMSMADNIKFNKKVKDPKYPRYDNYDAIEVPATNAIPSDYDGVMGVPISFLDKYCPEQFEIVGTISAPSDPNTLNLGKDYSEYIGYTQDRVPNKRTGATFGKCPVIVMDDHKHPYYEKGNIRVKTTYHRVFIRKKK